MPSTVGMPWLAAAALAGLVVGFLAAQWRTREKIRHLKESINVWKTKAETERRYHYELARAASPPPDPTAPVTPVEETPAETSPQPGPSPPPESAPSVIERAQPEPQFSAHTVAALYARWCTEGRKPPFPATVRATPLRFAGSTRVNEWTPPVHSFQDHPQMGEFVRFSDANDGGSCALPHPESPFSEVVHPLLFSQLTSAEFAQPARLASLCPVPLRRRDERTWEVAS